MIGTLRRTGFAVVAFGSMMQPALAATGIETQSAVYVERIEPGNVRSLEPAERFRPGERVVTILSWAVQGNDRRAGNTGFVITNPLPRAIAYQQSARDGELVSVDGGRTWGQLGQLTVANRMATPEDVTHVRWRITPAKAAQGRGHIAYSGIVR